MFSEIEEIARAAHAISENTRDINPYFTRPYAITHTNRPIKLEQSAIFEPLQTQWPTESKQDSSNSRSFIANSPKQCNVRKHYNIF